MPDRRFLSEANCQRLFNRSAHLGRHLTFGAGAAAAKQKAKTTFKIIGQFEADFEVELRVGNHWAQHDLALRD